MKMSRRERRAFNLGKQVGYADGYAKGFHDGNPFNTLIEAIGNMANAFAESMKDPEFAAAWKAYQEHPELMDEELFIEGDDDDEY